MIDKHKVYDLLHGANRPPRADGRGRRVRDRRHRASRCACSARSASRSIRKRGSGITASSARQRCPIVDTWWQTETGGALMTPLPGAHALKPGSAAKPFFGIRPQLVDDKGTILEGAVAGNLVHPRFMAGPDAHRLWRSPALRRHLFPHLSRQVLHRRRLPPRRGRLLLDHRPRR